MDYSALAHKVADYLQGTAHSLEEALEEHEMCYDDMPKEFFDSLDQIIFECQSCNWWCEISEMTDDEEHDWCCSDCAPNKD